MTEQERKDADIVRAAQGCGKGNCFACNYDEYTDCKKVLIDDLVGVIDRKDRRIEELEERIAIMTEGRTQDRDAEIVRCKDCKNHGTMNCPMCEEGNCIFHTADNWFCKDGERREQE